MSDRVATTEAAYFEDAADITACDDAAKPSCCMGTEATEDQADEKTASNAAK